MPGDHGLARRPARLSLRLPCWHSPQRESRHMGSCPSEAHATLAWPSRSRSPTALTALQEDRLFGCLRRRTLMSHTSPLSFLSLVEFITAKCLSSLHQM